MAFPAIAIVVLRIDAVEEIDIVRQLLRASSTGSEAAPVDVVILNERATSYMQDLQGALEGMVRPFSSGQNPATMFAARFTSCGWT
jgi:cyclic beta-1,2-glucan synthetase